MSEMILELKDLTKIFKKKNSVFTAVDHLSLAIEKGGCTGLVGESGSGKTTVANLVGGFLTPDHGHIIFEGSDLLAKENRTRHELRKNMQMIFQNPMSSFSTHMTIFEGIGEGIQYYEKYSRMEREKRILDVMEMVKLPKAYREKRCYELSGGECQRAAIARTIIIKPTFLICDEPTSALDVAVQGQIMALLSQLREDLGISYLFISHDLPLVRQFCDDIYVMYHGEVVEHNTTPQLFQSPKHPYTKKLLDSVLTI